MESFNLMVYLESLIKWHWMKIHFSLLLKIWENGKKFVLDNAGGLRPDNTELTEQSEW